MSTTELGQIALVIGSVAARVLAMLIAFKFLSNTFGVESFGILSQAMAIGAVYSTIAGGGLSTGLVREIAAAQDETERAEWLKAGCLISLASAVALILSAIALYLGSASSILGEAAYVWVFLVIALAQLPVAMGNTALAYLSGATDPAAIALSGILGSIVSAGLVVLVGTYLGFDGALAACALFALGPALVAIAFASTRRADRVREALNAKINGKKVKTLLEYASAMLIAATAVPIALVHIRSQLGATNGWQTVGEWQSVARIGDAYIQVFGALFIILMLPQLSQATTRA